MILRLACFNCGLAFTYEGGPWNGCCPRCRGELFYEDSRPRPSLVPIGPIERVGLLARLVRALKGAARRG